jgi:hypothetical protein
VIARARTFGALFKARLLTAPVLLGACTPHDVSSRSQDATLPRAAAASVEVSGVRAHRLRIGESEIDVSFDPAELDARELMAWIERCARAVEAFYGAFPVRSLAVRLHAVEGRGVRGGRALPTDPPRIDISVGRRSSARHLALNWSMTHEMVHLAFPNVASKHHWLEEGLASYVEPIARARVGWLTEEDVWEEWLTNMHHGLPEPGDRGLDGTDSWGRTYWGGALFCLLADVEIRKRTNNRRELGDALRAIARQGNISQRWPIERALRVGDEATGTTVLEELYEEMKDEAVPVELDELWRELGVEHRAGEIRYEAGAPLAAIRETFVLGVAPPPAP